MATAKKKTVPVKKAAAAHATKKGAKAKPTSSKPKTTAAKAKTAPASAKPKALLKSAVRPSLMSQLVSSGAGPVLPVRLQAVVDKSEIADILYHFGRGHDRMDETVLRSVFHPDATVDLGPGLFQGTSGDFVHWVLGVLNQSRETHHLIGNVQATLEGDTAFVESYCQAHFRLDKPTGREDVFIGSRFLDRMERRPGGPAGVWKVAHHKQIIDWVRTEAVSDIFYHQNPDALWSFRTKMDPSYQMAQFPGSQSTGKLPAFLGRRYESKSVKF